MKKTLIKFTTTFFLPAITIFLFACVVVFFKDYNKAREIRRQNEQFYYCSKYSEQSNFDRNYCKSILNKINFNNLK